MDNIMISNMSIYDLEKIKDKLTIDFDDFWTESILKKELLNKDSIYIIAKINDEIIGFGGIWKSVDDIHINNIVIRKDFRHQGIGSKILNELINLSKKANKESITLEVNCNNENAINLYLNFGFEKLGIRKKYYNQTDDAIIMTLSLKNQSFIL